jgi:hypothetical protein
MHAMDGVSSEYLRVRHPEGRFHAHNRGKAVPKEPKGTRSIPSKLMDKSGRFAMPPAIKSLGKEEGQVWNYVLNILLAAVLLGFLITQCGPVIWNHIALRGTADAAAAEAAMEYAHSRGNMDRVKEVVEKLLGDRDARLDGPINVERDEMGRPVRIGVPVRKIVNTYIFEKISYLCRYTEAKAYAEKALE